MSASSPSHEQFVKDMFDVSGQYNKGKEQKAAPSSSSADAASAEAEKKRQEDEAKSEAEFTEELAVMEKAADKQVAAVYEALQKEQKDAEAERAKEQKVVDDKQNELTDLGAKAATLERAIEDAQAALDQSKEALQAEKDALQILEEALNDVRKQMVKLRDELREAQVLETQLAEEVTVLEREVQGLQQIQERLNQAMQLNEAKKEEKEEELQEVLDMLQQLQTDLLQFKQEQQQAQAELKQALATAQQTAAELATIDIAIEMEENKRNKATAELQEANIKKQKAEANKKLIRGDMDRLEMQMRENEKEAERLDAVAQALKSIFLIGGWLAKGAEMAAAAKRADAKALTAQIANKRDRLGDEEKTLSEAGNSIKDAEGRRNAADTAILGNRGERTQKRSALAVADRAVQDAQVSLRNKQGDVQRATYSITVKKQEQKAHKTDLKTLANESKAISCKLDKAKQQIEVKTNQEQAARSKQSALAAQIAAKGDEIEVKEREVRDAQARFDAKRTEVEKCKEDMTAKENDKRKYVAELSVKEQELAAAKVFLAAAVKRVENVNTRTERFEQLYKKRVDEIHKRHTERAKQRADKRLQRQQMDKEYLDAKQPTVAAPAFNGPTPAVNPAATVKSAETKMQRPSFARS